MKLLTVSIVTLLILSACGAPLLPTPVTVTQPPVVVTATSDAPPTPTAPDPTPSEEVVLCDTVQGAEFSPHCGVGTYEMEVNPNAELSQAGRVRIIEIPFQDEVIKRDVVQVVPEERYEWAFDVIGRNGTDEIRNFAPIIRHDSGDFDINITGLFGDIKLQLHGQDVYTFPGRYAVGFEMQFSDLRLRDGSPNNPALIVKECEVHTDTGNRYILPTQNAGSNQYQNDTLQAGVWVIAPERDLTIVLDCGIEVKQAVFEGQVRLTRFFVQPVPPDYGVGSEITIR